jgi:hypothetical protein
MSTCFASFRPPLGRVPLLLPLPAVLHGKAAIGARSHPSWRGADFFDCRNHAKFDPKNAHSVPQPTEQDVVFTKAARF